MEDPWGEDTYHAEDASSAVGMAVLDLLSKGADIVMVWSREEGYTVAGYDHHSGYCEVDGLK